MTLAQIYKLALRQLDEDIEDISDYAEMFRQYANEGIQIVMNEYFKPCEKVILCSDENGRICLYGWFVYHVMEVADAYGRTLPFVVSPDGGYVNVDMPETNLLVTFQRLAELMTDDQEQPPFPEANHFVLVDYICYRKLLSGNTAKQNRARAFYDSFILGCRRIRPQGDGCVKTMRNLYAASSIHARR